MKFFTSALVACLAAQTNALKYENYAAYRAPNTPIALEAKNKVMAEFKAFEKTVEGTMVNWACVGCTAVTDLIDDIFNWQITWWIVEHGLSLVCELTGMVGDRFKVCPAMIDQFYTPAVPVLQDYIFSRDRICAEKLGVCRTPIIEQIDLEQVVHDILATKPESIRDDNFIDNLYAQIAADPNPRETYTALHISDVHIDKDYVVGSLANCNEYLCCRDYAGYPEHRGDIPAAQWGSGLCDLPVPTFQTMLDYIVSDVKPDMMFWTGDNSPHNIWYNTEEECTDYTITVSEMFKKAFEGQDISVFPIQGNHDTWVEEIQDFSAPGINYPINNFKEHWSQWLDEQAMEVFGQYGYYSMEMKLMNGKKLPHGSRLIAYNTQACNSLNWYVFGERADPGNHYAWLYQQLLEVEAEGGIAFMIAHYTPNDCQHQFGTRYRALMERFQHIVRFGMQGHTHTTFYEVTKSMSTPGKAILLNNIGGSVTTYTNKNPSFMTIEFDAQTMLPVNMYQYTFDLEKANEDGNSPEWFMQHDYLEEYGLKDLSPSSLLDLSERFLTDVDLALQFSWNEKRRFGTRPTSVDQLGQYCITSTSEMHEYHDCLVNNGMSTSPFGLAYTPLSGMGIVDRLVGNWINIKE